MNRYRQPPITEAELWQDGGLVTVRDVANITHLSRQRIIAFAESGQLEYIRYHPTGKFQFKREVVRAWLLASGHRRPAA
jgi:hypothetical protein